LDGAQGQRNGLTNNMSFDITVFKIEATTDDIKWIPLTFKKKVSHLKQ